MKTNHSQTAAFLVFSWMIFLSFFNNKKNNQPASHPISIQTIQKKIVRDSISAQLTYEAGQPPSLVKSSEELERLTVISKK